MAAVPPAGVVFGALAAPPVPPAGVVFGAPAAPVVPALGVPATAPAAPVVPPAGVPAAAPARAARPSGGDGARVVATAAVGKEQFVTGAPLFQCTLQTVLSSKPSLFFLGVSLAFDLLVPEVAAVFVSMTMDLLTRLRPQRSTLRTGKRFGPCRGCCAAWSRRGS